MITGIGSKIAVAVSGAILVAATAAQSAPLLQGAAPNLSFDACEELQTITVWNGGTDILEWGITFDQSWLSAVPAWGSNPPGRENQTVVTIYVDRAGLPIGTHSGHYTITSNGGTFVRSVTLLVQPAPVPVAGPSVVTLALQSATATYWISNGGGGTLDWSVSATEPWIGLLPPVSGSLPCSEKVFLTATLVTGGLPSPDEAQSGQIVFETNAGEAVLTVHYAPPGAGIIGLYADPAGSNCNIFYTGSGLVPVYVVHTHTGGATGCEFAAPKPVCWTNAMWLSDSDPFPIQIGNSQTGKSVGYGSCRASATVVTTINYFVLAPPTQVCCSYPVVPHPVSGHIWVGDCADNLLDARGAPAVIYPDASCLCESVVRVEETTWGRLKAMYESP
jgi:hypothetical protein